VTERVAGRVLSLPLYPELEEDELRQICDAVNAFSDRAG
jgi:dTDP-4-amino-4,6-dideoxygalactose transaminase